MSPIPCILSGLLFLAGLSKGHAREHVDFNREVRPILSEHCWRCHGFDEQARQAGLRLDDPQAAILPADSGERAIVPGHPELSHLIARVKAHDLDSRMPPADTPRSLTPGEIETLERWIAQGAHFQRHWAFEPIKRPTPPKVDGAVHPIDRFVWASLQKQGLKPLPEADAATLLRRVSLDLTGLPPTIDELDRLPDEDYEQSVDRLLASPHFGERMAIDWLDAARFADTDGYFGDKPRQMWLWRDWVIQALNSNMPFDQFTIEQLAGDLLPSATIDQQIATGFNRNHMSNDESGLIDEEYRVEYVADRVDTTMSTWLGLTVACAQCHDHKYDPLTQREYYQLFAFFNNVPEKGLLVGHDAPPRLSVPSDEQKRELTELTVAANAASQAFEPLKSQTLQSLKEREAELLEALPTPPSDGEVLHSNMELPLGGWRAMGTSLQSAIGVRGQAIKCDGTQHVETDLPLSLDEPWTIGFWFFPDGSLSCPLSCIEPEGDRCGMEVLWRKGRIMVHLVHQWDNNAIEVSTRSQITAKQWHHVVISHDGSRRSQGLSIHINGEAAALDVRRDSLTGSLTNSEPLRIGRRDDGLGFYGLLDELRLLRRVVTTHEAADWRRAERIGGILEIAPEKRSESDALLLLDDFIDHYADSKVRTARDAVRESSEAERQLRAKIPTTLVMDELSPPRQTRILERGQYDKPRAEVEPGVPTAILSWPSDLPRNRLGFARWLFLPENPLAARVTVNRLWQQCFGEGLVRTVNDFGTQGEPPTHPELLDYLAATFRDGGWNVKSLLRLIVTSQTYRQQSQFHVQDGETVDPENRWLARGPSFRLPMEMIRDQALASSGLLVRHLGGPSVKPYQPAGLWEEVSYNGDESYLPDEGDGLWRRSLYTYIKRQAPPPALLLFDGPTREKCTLHRPRTNTPLQALLLLNDETYVEAGRRLAQKALLAKRSDQERLTYLCRSVLSRPPRSEESHSLLGLLDRQRQRFASGPVAAKKLLAVGATSSDDADPIELAAWTVVAHVILNLDETVTRR